MSLKKIEISELKKIANKYGLTPAAIKGTKGVQIVKNMKDKYEVLDWDEFESRLKTRKLAVYKDKNDWLKIMSNK